MSKWSISFTTKMLLVASEGFPERLPLTTYL
jgi:hypothetical protein